MATDKNTLDNLLEKLGRFGLFTVRPMMGEYLLYFNGKYIGGIFDGRPLIKITKSNAEKLKNAEYLIPYPGSSPHIYLNTEAHGDDEITEFLKTTYEQMPEKKKK